MSLLLGPAPGRVPARERALGWVLALGQEPA